ncbi:hypothetical protein PAPYR_4200 [Paratrimastix pyriformis]|uniref:Helicase C-terminal domain-containing protein n=1 Tax=Paratrimastix pyriformis TaxID=342808 RepID=A0ABQ8ULV7_9EUKA|nr:hypothetical protein PAPYR_4200 [Paratrimastix pyriformis]
MQGRSTARVDVELAGGSPAILFKQGLFRFSELFRSYSNGSLSESSLEKFLQCVEAFFAQPEPPPEILLKPEAPSPEDVLFARLLGMGFSEAPIRAIFRSYLDQHPGMGIESLSIEEAVRLLLPTSAPTAEKKSAGLSVLPLSEAAMAACPSAFPRRDTHGLFAPSPLQQRILRHMHECRTEAGHSRGLVVLSTGAGKTVLSILDVSRQLVDMAASHGYQTPTPHARTEGASTTGPGRAKRPRISPPDSPRGDMDRATIGSPGPTDLEAAAVQLSDQSDDRDRVIPESGMPSSLRYNRADADQAEAIWVIPESPGLGGDDLPASGSAPRGARRPASPIEIPDDEDPVPTSPPPHPEAAAAEDPCPLGLGTWFEQQLKPDPRFDPGQPRPDFLVLYLVHSAPIRDAVHSKFQAHFGALGFPGTCFMNVSQGQGGLGACTLARYRAIVRGAPRLRYALGMTATLQRADDPGGTRLRRLFRGTVYVDLPWTVAKSLGHFPPVEYCEMLPTLAGGRDVPTYGCLVARLREKVGPALRRGAPVSWSDVNDFLRCLDGSLRQLDMASIEKVHAHLTATAVSAQLLRYQRAREEAHLPPRRRVLVFMASCACADEAARLLRRAGCRAAAAHSKMRRDGAQGALDRFLRGDLDVLCTVMMVQEGYDLPGIDCVVLARVTQSENLFVQQMGRGLRKDATDPDKECAVLDLALNLRRRWRRLQGELSGAQLAAQILAFWDVTNFVGSATATPSQQQQEQQQQQQR